MANYTVVEIQKTERITKLIDNLYANMPVIEASRGVLLTESYKQTENEPIISRRAKAFLHICKIFLLLSETLSSL